MREITENLTCDFEGCRKTPLKGDNDHVVLTVLLETQDGTRVPAAGGTQLDFCSFDHAGKHLKSLGDLAATQVTAAREAPVPGPPSEDPEAAPTDGE